MHTEDLAIRLWAIEELLSANRAEQLPALYHCFYIVCQVQLAPLLDSWYFSVDVEPLCVHVGTLRHQQLIHEHWSEFKGRGFFFITPSNMTVKFTEQVQSRAYVDENDHMIPIAVPLQSYTVWCLFRAKTCFPYVDRNTDIRLIFVKRTTRPWTL